MSNSRYASIRATRKRHAPYDRNHRSHDALAGHTVSPPIPSDYVHPGVRSDDSIHTVHHSRHEVEYHAPSSSDRNPHNAPTVDGNGIEGDGCHGLRVPCGWDGCTTFVFPDRSEVFRHLKRKHGLCEEPVKCRVACSNEPLMPNSLARHWLKHLDMWIQCTACDYKCKRVDQIKRHKTKLKGCPGNGRFVGGPTAEVFKGSAWLEEPKNQLRGSLGVIV